MTGVIDCNVSKDIAGWDVIPEDVRREFDNAFNKNIKVVELNQCISLYQKNRDFIKELQARKMLQSIREKAQEDLLSQLQDKAIKITTTLRDIGLTDKQMNRVNVLMIAAYMACDMIDALCIDINSELRKVDDTAELAMFQPMRELGKQAKENLTYLWKSTHMFDTDVFNDVSDDMLEILTNKARKIYRKYIEHAVKVGAKNKT